MDLIMELTPSIFDGVYFYYLMIVTMQKLCMEILRHY